MSEDGPAHHSTLNHGMGDLGLRVQMPCSACSAFATPERPRQHSRRSMVPDGVEADHLPFAYTSTAAHGPS